MPARRGARVRLRQPRRRRRLAQTKRTPDIAPQVRRDLEQHLCMISCTQPDGEARDGGGRPRFYIADVLRERRHVLAIQ